jgi:hypothetical protein
VHPRLWTTHKRLKPIPLRRYQAFALPIFGRAPLSDPLGCRFKFTFENPINIMALLSLDLAVIYEKLDRRQAAYDRVRGSNTYHPLR